MLQGYLNCIRYSRPFQSLEHLKPILVHLSCWDTISDNWISCYVQKSGADNTQLRVSRSKKRFSVMHMSNWLKKKREKHIKPEDQLTWSFHAQRNLKYLFLNEKSFQGCSVKLHVLGCNHKVMLASSVFQVKMVKMAGRNVFCNHWLSGTHCLFQLDQALVIHVI